MSLIETTASTREIAEGMYKSAIAGDLEGFFAVVSPDVVVKEPPFLPHGGDYVGIPQMQALFGTVAEIIDLSTLTVDRILADGDQAIGLLRMTTLKGEELALAELLTFRDGKAVELKVYFHDVASLAG